MGDQKHQRHTDAAKTSEQPSPAKAFIQPVFTDPQDFLEFRTRRRAYSKLPTREASLSSPSAVSQPPTPLIRAQPPPTSAETPAPSKVFTGRFALSSFSVPSNSGPSRPTVTQRRLTTPQREFAPLVAKARDEREQLPLEWQQDPSPTPSDFSTDSTLEALAIRLSVETAPSHTMSSGPATAGPTPRDASRPRSPDLVDPPLVEPYLTGDDYVRDAAILVETWEAEGGHAPRTVAHLLRDIDYAAAKAALSMLPRRRRNQFQTVAQQQVYGAYSPAKFPDLFHRIIERFHQGPPDYDDDANEGRELPSRPPPLNRTPEIPRAFSPPGHCGYTSRGDQDRPRPSTRDREQGFNYAAAGLKAFQPRHISFNGSLPVTTYISRLRRMARCYSEKAVLTNLPLAMEGDAGEWMDGLPQSLLEDMDDSLDMWIDQLRLRFSSNISEVLAKADALRHSFAEEDTLSVRQFLSQKVQLYREAGETSEDTMVRRMHRDLDPELARDVRLYAAGNTLADFQSQVIAQSATSYRAWKQSQASIQSLFQARFATRPQPRDRDRFDIGRRFDTLATPRYAAYSAATAQATTTEHLATTSGITRRLLEGPPNETAAVPAAARRTAPPRYPCTHCGSLDHIDPNCSKHPRRVAAAARAVAKDLPRPAGAPTVPAVRAYYAEANSAPPDEDLMGFDDDGDEFPHADPLEGAGNCLAGQ